MLYGVNTLRNSTSRAAELAAQSRSDAETAEQQAQLAQIQLKTLDSKTSELRLVYGEWKPHFEAHRTPQDAEQRIAEVESQDEQLLGLQRLLDARAGGVLRRAGAPLSAAPPQPQPVPDAA